MFNVDNLLRNEPVQNQRNNDANLEAFAALAAPPAPPAPPAPQAPVEVAAPVDMVAVAAPLNFGYQDNGLNNLYGALVNNNINIPYGALTAPMWNVAPGTYGLPALIPPMGVNNLPWQLPPLLQPQPLVAPNPLLPFVNAFQPAPSYMTILQQHLGTAIGQINPPNNRSPVMRHTPSFTRYRESPRTPSTRPHTDVINSARLNTVMMGVGPFKIFQESMDFIKRHSILKRKVQLMAGLSNRAFRHFEKLNDVPNMPDIRAEFIKFIHWYISVINFPEHFDDVIFPSNSPDGFSFRDELRLANRKKYTRSLHRSLVPSPRGQHHRQFMNVDLGQYAMAAPATPLTPINEAPATPMNQNPMVENDNMPHYQELLQAMMRHSLA